MQDEKLNHQYIYNNNNNNSNSKDNIENNPNNTTNYNSHTNINSNSNTNDSTYNNLHNSTYKSTPTPISNEITPITTNPNHTHNNSNNFLLKKASSIQFHHRITNIMNLPDDIKYLNAKNLLETETVIMPQLNIDNKTKEIHDLIYEIDSTIQELEFFRKQQRKEYMIKLIKKVSYLMNEDMIDVEDLKDYRLFGDAMNNFEESTVRNSQSKRIRDLINNRMYSMNDNNNNTNTNNNNQLLKRKRFISLGLKQKKFSTKPKCIKCYGVASSSNNSGSSSSGSNVYSKIKKYMNKNNLNSINTNTNTNSNSNSNQLRTCETCNSYYHFSCEKFNENNICSFCVNSISTNNNNITNILNTNKLKFKCPRLEEGIKKFNMNYNSNNSQNINTTTNNSSINSSSNFLFQQMTHKYFKEQTKNKL